MHLVDRDGLKSKGIRHCRSQLWRLAKADKFPKPIKVGSLNAWVEAEIDAWIRDRVKERDRSAAA